MLLILSFWNIFKFKNIDWCRLQKRGVLYTNGIRHLNYKMIDNFKILFNENNWTITMCTFFLANEFLITHVQVASTILYLWTPKRKACKINKILYRFTFDWILTHGSMHRHRSKHTQKGWNKHMASAGGSLALRTQKN